MEMFILLLASKAFTSALAKLQTETYKVQRSWVCSDFEPFVMYICHSCYRCCCRRRICVYVFCVCLRRLVHVIIISKSGVVSLWVACERLPCCEAEYVNDNFSFSTMKIVDKYMVYDYVSHYQVSVCECFVRTYMCKLNF